MRVIRTKEVLAYTYSKHPTSCPMGPVTSENIQAQTVHKSMEQAELRSHTQLHGCNPQHTFVSRVGMLDHFLHVMSFASPSEVKCITWPWPTI